MFKKIDRLLIRSFIPPFVVTFFIAIFVLMMQYLWVFIDKIIGKGAGLFFIIEILFYLSVSLIPMALPIAVLISSVMVMGNLAERYELSSIKSAGVPLMRTMRPLIFICVIIAIFSFLSSNYLMPVATLKSQSRLHDLRRQKPTLSLEEGVFNDDFKDFTIHIGKKGEDNRSIEDIIIYQNRVNSNEMRISEILAGKGEMYTTEDKEYFVMNLENGTQYEQLGSKKKGTLEKQHAYVRTNFDKWQKVFDLDEFEIKITDENLFSNHHKMQSVRQLASAIDTIERKMDHQKENLFKYSERYFYPFTIRAKEEIENKREAKKEEKEFQPQNILQNAKKGIEEKRQKTETKLSKDKPEKNPQKPSTKINPQTKKKSKPPSKPKKPKIIVTSIKQEITKPLPAYSSFMETLTDKSLKPILKPSETAARSLLSHAESTKKMVKKNFEKRVKHIFELYLKFSLAVVCIVFLFIGAPLGAIVRKGGFGFPILVAISGFILYFVANVGFKNTAEQGVIDPFLAVWIPILMLLPIGFDLTRKAMNDSRILSFEFFKKNY